jgi:putative metalloenzyme radical SAM/SPASM domain maturase
MKVTASNTVFQDSAQTAEDLPRKLVVEPTTQCNLQCAMCLKQGPGNLMPEGELSPALWEALAPALPHLEALVFSGIGEPLLHPGLEGFIAQARQAMPSTGWVGLQSNGYLLDEARARSLAEAGLDRVCLSLDSVEPEVLAGLRRGTNVPRLEGALRALQKARAATGSSLRMGVEVVVMRSNLAELPAILEWAAARGAGFALVTHMLPYDPAMLEQMLWPTGSGAVAGFFGRWQQRAQKQGVDLTGYFGAVFSYNRDEAQRRTVDFLKTMRAEARARGLSLNLSRLLGEEPELLAWVEDIFGQAKDTAARLGLELILPSPRPRHQRHCPFVESGAALVSWRGTVHPCHFLWHRYTCHLPDRAKPVEPLAFGDLRRQGIAGIWGNPAYAEFRKRVRAYDYPYCLDCKVAPCDYLGYGEEPTRDCYGGQVPCGDCPWPLGLLNCLL